MLFEERIELMRKAKVAAIVLGSVSSCLFGGLFAVYATAPTVTSVTPKNTAQIQDVEIEELANAAAVTPIRTTAVTTSKATTKAASTTTAVTTTTTTVVEQITEAPVVVTTEAPTQAATEAVTVTTVPTTEPPVVEYAANVPEEPEVIYYDEPLYEEETVQEETTDYTEPETFVEETYVETTTVDTSSSSSLPISDEEYIILCNAVGHEAGCNWISEYDKAKVVEVIMNRVYSPLYPNNIYDVLTQRYQFEGAQGYVNLGTYASYVTESVKNAVNLYFSDPASFQHGYFSFYGDGYQNYFV